MNEKVIDGKFCDDVELLYDITVLTDSIFTTTTNSRFRYIVSDMIKNKQMLMTLTIFYITVNCIYNNAALLI